MRALLHLTLLSLLPGVLTAQQVVDHSKVRRYAGEIVTVRGPIARATVEPGGVVWFSIGKPHPSSSLVVVVNAEEASGFGDPRKYEGAMVEVQGRILTGAAEGIGIDPTVGGASGGAPTSISGRTQAGGAGVALRGRAPKSPFIVLQNPGLFRVVENPKVPVDTTKPAPETPPPGR